MTKKTAHPNVRCAAFLLFFCRRFCCSEAIEVLGLEHIDVGGFACDVLGSHADVDVGTLLEELRSLSGIAEDEPEAALGY